MTQVNPLVSLQNTIDYSECEKETLDCTAAFQSQGAVLILDGQTHAVIGVSENWFSFTQNHDLTWPETPIEVSELLKDPLELHDVTTVVSCLTPKPDIVYRKKLFELQAVRSGAFIFIEWLTVSIASQNLDVPVLASLVTLDAQNIYKTLQDITGVLKETLFLDRVMIYQFDEDYSGDIVAETRREDWAPYLGLHYPATDIPKIARELFLKVPFRQICDSVSQPNNLLTLSDYPSQNIDLTQCSLRSVSPFHLEYLRNMGVRSTLSVAIVYQGKLWGLISCHHGQPLVLGLQAKQYLVKAARTIEASLGEWHAHQKEIEQKQVAKIILEQKEGLQELAESQYAEALAVLLLGVNGLESITGADAAAIYADGVMASTGNVPETAWIERFLAKWREEAPDQDSLFISHELQKEPLVPTEEPVEMSGMLALRVSQDPSVVIFAFRQEFHHEVHWGGDPNQRSSGAHDYSPRRSFQLWKETVLNKARAWTDIEVGLFKGFKKLLTEHFSLEQLLHVLKSGMREMSVEMSLHTYIAKALTSSGSGGMSMTVLETPHKPTRLLNMSQSLNNAFSLYTAEKKQEEMRIDDVLNQLGLTQEQIDSLSGVAQRVQLWSPRLGHRVVKISRRRLLSLSEKEQCHCITSLQFFDVTSEERVATSLRSAHLQVEQANAAKITFLTHTSQELMVPLQRVLSLSERLDDELKQIELDDLNLYTEQITYASRHMLNRVKQLLFFSRSATGNLHLRTERLNLSLLLKECVKWLQQFAQSRQIIIKYDTEEEVWVVGNKETLQHMFVNVLDNAVRYSHQGAVVDCRIKQNQKGQNVFLEIEDHGKGINASELSKVFLPFYSGDHSEQLDTGEGAGVGLTLVKHIVEAHKGHINLESNVNIGTQVHIMLPRHHEEKSLELKIPAYG